MLLPAWLNIPLILVSVEFPQGGWVDDPAVRRRAGSREVAAFQVPPVPDTGWVPAVMELKPHGCF